MNSTNRIAFVVVAVIVLALLLPQWGASKTLARELPTPTPSWHYTTSCQPNCIWREPGTRFRRYAVYWYRGRCPGDAEGDQDDWITYYPLNGSAWRNPDYRKVKFYAERWSPYRYYRWSKKVGIISPGPNYLVLCLSGARGSMPSWAVRGTWVWLKP